ncbi:4731_t:CDS:2, partial [Rhizophagus irregularis]
ELGKYLRGEEQIKIEIHDKNEVIIEKKILAKKTTNNGGKRKKVSTPIKGNEGMTLESQFTGIDNQNEEINDIEKLVEKYLDLGDINSRAIQKWYFLGRDFERKVEEMKNQGRKKKSEQTARRDLYNEMMGLLVKGDEDAEEKLRVRGALKERMQGA